MKSKLALGTVQFGLDYGVTNKQGKLTNTEARKVLKFAERNNITTLDTASSYGNSEKVLGEIGISNFEIITKTIPLEEDIDDVIVHFFKSLKNLNISKVEGLLIHDINDVKKEHFQSLYRELNQLKREGLIDKLGFSIYTSEQVDQLIDSFDFDLIQLPINVFDVRLLEGGQLKSLNQRGIEIHARSIFLQGLLLDLKNIPRYFSRWEESFKQYQEIVKNKELSLLEYALSFVSNIHEIDKVVVGVNSRDELIEINNSSREIRNLEPFPIDDVKLLNPSMWNL